MFKEEGESFVKYQQLKVEYEKIKSRTGGNNLSPSKRGNGSRRIIGYDFYNEIEKTVLGLNTQPHELSKINLMT